MNELQRKLKLGSACAVTAGSVIGSAVFLVAAEIARAVPSPMVGMSVWVVAGLISLMGGLIFAELGAMYPQAGGQYRYLTEAFPPWVGFLFGWALILVIQSGSIAAVAVSFSRFFGQIITLTPLQEKFAAGSVVLAVTALNGVGVREAVGVLDVITFIKALALLAIGSLAFMAPSTGVALEPVTTFTVSGYGVALIAAFWAYDGWNNLGFVAGDIVDPQRNLPKAAFFGIVSVALLYLGVNFAYSRWLTPAAIAGSSFVAADLVGNALGASAIPWLSALVAFSALGCVNALTLGGARVIFAMGRDGSLPPALGQLNGRGVPVLALLAQMVWTLLLIFSGTYDQLFTYVVFAAFLFYGLTALAMLRLRRIRPDYPRPYRVPFYPWLPLGYFAFTLVFTLNAIVEKPVEALAGVGIVLSGLPVWWWRQRRRSSFAITGARFDIF